MKHAALLLACVAPLAACDRSPKVNEKNATIAEVAKAVGESGVASDNFMRAGSWKVTSTVEEMSYPGMPAQAQAEMNRMAGHETSFQYCLSPEEAKRPRGKFFSGKDEGNCRYDHFTMGGGKIDAVMRCGVSGTQGMTMTMNGEYAADHYTTHVAMQVSGGRGGGMTVKAHSEARRIGECTGKEGNG